MRSVFALGLMAFAGFAAAQDQPQNNYPYTIDPDSVAGSDRRESLNKPHTWLI